MREEREGDAPRVRQVLESAFGRAREPDLVDKLRHGGSDFVSLVALDGDDLVAVAVLTPVTIEVGVGVSGFGLAPVGVLPDHRRRGIGTALVRHSLLVSRRRGVGFVVVLGDPAYYRRFGFVPASRFDLTCDFGDSPEAFQAVELVKGSLAGYSGAVNYLSAFSAVAL